MHPPAVYLRRRAHLLKAQGHDEPNAKTLTIAVPFSTC